MSAIVEHFFAQQAQAQAIDAQRNEAKALQRQASEAEEWDAYDAAQEQIETLSDQYGIVQEEMQTLADQFTADDQAAFRAMRNEK